MSKKKKTNRSKVKNASLKKQYNSRIRQEYLDLDYLDKLDDTKATCKLPDGRMVTELEYIALFMKEWNSGGVGKQADAKENSFHRTAKEVKACTDRTNERNRDEYGIAKAKKLVNRVEFDTIKELSERKENINYNYVEDALIDVLDEMKKTSNTSDDSNKK